MRNMIPILLVIFLFTSFVSAQDKNISTQEVKLPVLAPAVEKKIEQRTPKAFPQTRPPKRETTDVADDLLKGKVKKVVAYAKYYTNAKPDEEWKFDTIHEYSEKGDLTRRMLFGGDEVPYTIEVFGYLDGHRVGKSASYQENPGRYTVIRPGPKQTPVHPPDERYSSRYEFVYKNGELIERKILNNDGTQWMRYIYERTKDTRSYTAFDENDEINQRYDFKLDKDQNDIERTGVDVRKVYGKDRRFRISYQSFDENGNWTRRTFAEIMVVNGEESLITTSEQFRTITYYK